MHQKQHTKWRDYRHHIIGEKSAERVGDIRDFGKGKLEVSGRGEVKDTRRECQGQVGQGR